MSFAFGFGGDDIEDDDQSDELSRQVNDLTVDDVPLIPPKKHTLRELLASLPSQVSYNLLSIAKQQDGHSGATSELSIPRRSIFDMRTQLMAEADAEQNENEMLLAGLERGDLTSGIYEGGFKTWECSLDLASLVADLNHDSGFHIIELGAGSAVPSLVLLQRNLRQKSPSSPPLHFTLCDYNEDVLRLATAPNIFLASVTESSDESRTQDSGELDIEDIDEKVIEQCIQHLQTKGFSFDFVSGAWGDEFLSMIETSSQITRDKHRSTLILASETIYSPKSTVAFTDALMHLLRQDPLSSKAWVAAKKVYFGVGGSVDDFVQQVQRKGGSVKMLLDIQGVGVGRVVLEIALEA